VKINRFTSVALTLALTLSACSVTQADSVNTAMSQSNTKANAAASSPEWFDMELTDAQTGEIFTINDFAGKVVLLETMAIWCPNCTVQGNEVRKLHELLGNPEDLISVSLDVDYNEDQASLKDYVSEFGFDWRFAVAPLEMARVLGNLYTAQYLNPPLSPMMIIDRDGNVHHLEYGFKDAESLRKSVEPYLEK
jgi:cytochrome oxidase Cu insertion factor (SCO1/SenC/PrrC family)